MHIHGLIFKELLKRGYSRKGKGKVWNIADSKLWYITPEQAQAYINLDLNDNYQQFAGQKEAKELITENAKDILKTIKLNSFNVMDLGCGDGSKTIFIMEELKKLNSSLKIRYCPIDISSYFVEKSIETFSKSDFGKVINFHYNISDFDNLENITPLLREGEFKKNVLFLLGNTLDNFEIHELLYTIRTSMRKGDVFVLDTAINDNKQEDRVRTYVGSKKFYEWLIPLPLQLGLSKGDVTFSGRFKNSRIELYFLLNSDKVVNFQDKKVKFRKGDEIIVLTAYKYSADQLKEFLNMYFDNVTFKVGNQGSKILAICTL